MRARPTVRVDVLAVSTVVVLVVLAVSLSWAAVGLWSSTSQVAAATARVSAYQHLQDAVSAQAFAEAGYRRAPSPAARLRLDAAVTEVGASVAELRTVADPADGPMLSYLLVLNDRYVDEARRTLDTAQGESRDDRVAGPALDQVQQLVHAATDVANADVAAAVARQRRLVTTMAALLPGVLAVAAVGLTVGVRASRARARQLDALARDAERRSARDPLTGLANRAGLETAYEAAAAAPGALSVLVMDLDRFKAVNDEHGHAVGDALLVAVAERLRGALRPDDVVARLGGDEFVALLVGCDDPAPAAERVREAVVQPLVVAGVVVNPTVSIGAAVCGGDRGDRAAVLHRADVALYAAKQAGRDRVQVAAG